VGEQEACNATPLQPDVRSVEMFLTLASSDGVSASKKPANSTPLEFNARSGEMSRGATYVDWALAGKEQINPMPLVSRMRCYGTRVRVASTAEIIPGGAMAGPINPAMIVR
jgi:hypothetical protein